MTQNHERSERSTVDPDNTGRNEPRAHWLKILVVLGVIVSAAMFVHHLQLHNRVTIGQLRELRDSAGLLAPVVYVVVYIVGLLVAFPSLILSFSGGLLFGTVLGTVLTTIGASIGAMGAFGIARFAGRETVEKFVAGNAIGEFDRTVSGSGFSAVLFTRLVPIFPFSLVNFAWGLSGVTFRDYALATVVGMLPAVFIYSNIAGSIARSISDPNTTLSSVDYAGLMNRDVLLAFGLLGALTLVAPGIRYVRNRRANP